ncbi:hypothetical protein ACFL59_04280 [Planctomycetota bacterium]
MKPVEVKPLDAVAGGSDRGLFCGGGMASVAVVCLAMSLWTSSASAMDVVNGPEDRLSDQSLPAGVDGDWWQRIRKDLAGREYHVTWQEETIPAGLGPCWHAPNRAQDLRTYFSERGPRVVRHTSGTPEWLWGLELTGCGTERALTAPQAVANTTVLGNRVELDRGWLTEWYVNLSAGLEQGFTVTTAPEDGDRHLVLELAVRGDLTPGMMPGGQAIEFLKVSGSFVMGR